MLIRPATPADAPALAAIYAHHVLQGVATYEVDPPDAAEMAARLVQVTAAGWPWLVAQEPAGAILGYAYAAQLNPRAAYARTCEDSVYVDHTYARRGVGRAVLAALLDAARASGFRTMVAVIGGAEPASVALHSALGFAHAGRLERVGFKHGRWLDTVLMQRML